MRRRHVRSVQKEEQQSLLLMAAGAIAGAAAGLYLGRRYPSLDAFLSDVRERLDDLREVWYDEDELEGDARDRIRAAAADDDEFEAGLREDDDEFDAAEDDEDEDVEDELLDADALADDADDLDEDEDEDLEDELEEDLASVVRENGSTEASRSAESAARHLEARVLRALRDEPVLGERAIEIAVVGDGVVELTGTVHAIDEVSRAAAFARKIPGVSMVLNRIEVRTGGHLDTASVARDVAPAAGKAPKA